MAQIRSKQISDFLAQVNWATVKTTEIPNAFDVDARFDTVESDLVDESAARGAADSALSASVDSLETALSAEIEATNTDVTELYAALSAEADTRETEMNTHHDEHVSLITAESGRAIAAEGFLGASVDSLEVAVSIESERINAILDGSTVDLDQFAEVVSYVNGLDLVNDNSFISRETFVDGRLNRLDSSVDSLESALAGEIEATNGDVTAINASIDSLENKAGTDVSALIASVDSLEGVDADLQQAINSLEEKHNDEMNTHHLEHVSLITAEEERAIAAEGFLGASVDSLEVAVSIESERINAILDGSTVDLDQFAEVVSYVQGLDLVNDNSFISRELYVNNYLTSLDASVDSLESALTGEIEATNDDVTAIGASIDSLELALNNGSGALVDSVDSLELALAAEISTTNAEVAGINLSIDSLELALANEIEATNGDVLAIIDSVDSLELALTAETNLRIFGDTYAEVEVTGITAAAGPVVISSPVLFAEGSFDTEVYVNGLRVAFTQMNPNDFDLNLVYAIEASDIIRIVGVQA